MKFAELGLSDEVVRAVTEVGYETPTPIQEKAIPIALMGRDILGCAQTGTGKTASFTLPMIDILATGRSKARMPRCLIVEPTRELAHQVAENFDIYGKYSRLSMALLIGGERFGEQEKLLDRGVDVLIATPGRLLDMFERGKVLLNDVKVLVIDEADRMLDMGFIPDIERIVGLLPSIRQTLFFSATMPPEIRKLADQFLMNPKEISVAPPASPAETVKQHKIVVPSRDKRDALRELLGAHDVTNAIIFCNRKRDVDLLEKSLKKHGYDAAALHGDLPQYVRTQTLDRFREGEIRLLVASDVAARGLDIPRVSHVFNFDVPIHAEDYVHRIGRTGRAGRPGKSYTIAAPDDAYYLGQIEKMLGREIPAIELEGVAIAELEESDAKGRRRRSRRPDSEKADEVANAEEATRPARSRKSASAGTAAKRTETAVEDAKAGEDVTTTDVAAATEETASAKPRRRSRRRGGETEPRAEATDRAKTADRAEAAEPAPIAAANGGTDTATAASAEPKSRRGRGRGRPHDEDDTPTGFGDHVPAFLLRPAVADR